MCAFRFDQVKQFSLTGDKKTHALTFNVALYKFLTSIPAMLDWLALGSSGSSALQSAVLSAAAGLHSSHAPYLAEETTHQDRISILV